MWLLLALLAHCTNAIAFLVDKILITKALPNPISYTVYIGLLSLLAVMVIPFGVRYPETPQLTLDLAAGAAFVIALFFFFSALKRMELSRVVPLVGGLSPIVILSLSHQLVGERLARHEALAFALLIIGSVLITIEFRRKRTPLSGTLFALAATFIFGLAFSLSKLAYTREPFLSSFVFQRVGGAIPALLLLTIPSARAAVFFKGKKPTALKTKIIFVSNQALGAAGNILLNIAISMGSATLIQSLQGVQYAILFLLTVIISKIRPRLLHESLTRAIILQKTFALALIAVGLAILGKNI